MRNPPGALPAPVAAIYALTPDDDPVVAISTGGAK